MHSSPASPLSPLLPPVYPTSVLEAIRVTL